MGTNVPKNSLGVSKTIQAVETIEHSVVEPAILNEAAVVPNFCVSLACC